MKFKEGWAYCEGLTPAIGTVLHFNEEEYVVEKVGDTKNHPKDHECDACKLKMYGPITPVKLRKLE